MRGVPFLRKGNALRISEIPIIVSPMNTTISGEAEIPCVGHKSRQGSCSAVRAAGLTKLARDL